MASPAPPPRRAPFAHPVDLRYLEVDQQGVVFNMWYLAYFDDAMTAFLAAGGLEYTELQRSGFDVQVVHTELDWQGSLQWGDRASVAVEVAHVGRTSFTLRFAVHAGDRLVATGQTVYVTVRTDGAGKVQIPAMLLACLGDAGAGAGAGAAGT